MARKLRLEYPGALYHVINRGNYRRDLFETVGAAQSFVDAMEEAVHRHGWGLQAYVLMRNHLFRSRQRAGLVGLRPRNTWCWKHQSRT